jgi:putative membrane protein
MSAIPDSASPALPDVPWRRLSARMLLIHPVREVIRFIPVLFGVFVAGSHNGNGHWWSLIGLGVVLVLSVIRWATTRYQITADQIELRSGFLRKRIIAAPADRVRTVDVTEHALHRLLGLARVVIGTGTSDRKREGLVLDGLPVDAARALRAELLHRGQGAPGRSAVRAQGYPAAPDLNPDVPGWTSPSAGAPPAPPCGADPAMLWTPEVEILRLDPSWIRFAPFTLSGAVTALAVLGFSWNALQQSQVDAGKLGAIQSASRHFRDTPVWLGVLQAAVGVLIAVAVLSAVGYLLAFWNFRLTRHPGGSLQITRGLITTRSTSIEHRRLRGVAISEPLLLRAVGGARTVAVATGLRVGRGAERGGTVLVPPAPMAISRQVAGTVLDEHGAELALDTPLIPHGPAALRRRLIRAVVPFVALTGLLAVLWWAARWPVWPVLIAAVFAALAVPLGIDRYRSLGHAVVGGYLVSRLGSLDRRQVALECDGIIGWNVRRTLFQRRLGIVTAGATTAAGRQSYRLLDLTEFEALAVIRAATPGLLEPFLLSGPLPTPVAGRHALQE